MTYSPNVESRFRAPTHAGGPVSAQVLTGQAGSAGASGVLHLHLLLAENSVTHASFQALGCPVCIAAGDWACEWLVGKTLAQAANLSAVLIESALELSPDKRHIGLMVEDALSHALSQRKTR